MGTDIRLIHAAVIPRGLPVLPHPKQYGQEGEPDFIDKGDEVGYDYVEQRQNSQDEK